jgi:nitrite reductase (cytochrome c-552)
LLLGFIAVSALAAVGIAALLVTIFNRKQEARNPYIKFVEVTENTTDPAVWGVNWPRQYDSYLRTVDYERTRYGGSDAIPKQKLDSDPWLRTMWAGYAFSLDYREARGHAYMLADQDQTERVLQRPQPGACLHCHASIIPAYREVGNGDVMEGFRKISAMKWNDARHLTGKDGKPLVEHPLSCVDCHDPDNMAIRVTRPGFINGIRALKASQGVANYDVNRDATRQEMRSYVCGQCHVEYYFTPEGKEVVYPWSKGLKVENIVAYYDSIDFADWTHEITGARVLKAQHPEFEMWNQGIHAAAGVACADCHMPYERQGAMKVSDHHVRSPLLNVARACQPCHAVPEQELLRRAYTIQDRTQMLQLRAASALMDNINAISEAREAGATDTQLADARKLQREAQFRLDFIFSENSRGFHAPQEAARILAEAVDYARQGAASAVALNAPKLQPLPITPDVFGVTPEDSAPPGPLNPPAGGTRRGQ